MRALLAALLSLSVLPAAMAQAQRGIVLQAQPTSPLLPVPPTPPRLKPAPGGYEPAPTPNRDVDAPLGPRASNAPQGRAACGHRTGHRSRPPAGSR